MAEQSSSLRELAARLAQGPAFLILGSRSMSEPDSPSILYRWSGVYTSRTDDGVAAQFRTEWRTATSVGAMSSAPSRSQTDLQVRYLFGARHLPEAEQPPSDPLEEADARLRCVQEISRLVSETVTPRGVIVIDGWAPDDALDARDLVPALRQLGPKQVHVFSGAHWTDDPFIASLARSGQLVIHQQSLHEAFAELTESGAVATGPANETLSGQRVIALGDGFTEIDIHTWNQIRRSARPIDLDLLTPPIFSSEAARYQEFRNFAGATEGTPRWLGIAAGMNIRRDFEQVLMSRVIDALNEPELAPPIVVRGQTATGKSVAMAALAMDLARLGNVAVLHQARRTVRPTPEDIDMFASWAEDRGAKATVLVWDGMVDRDDYLALWRQLRSRGRKLLIIGSAYISRSANHPFIDAPAELSQAELNRLQQLLNSFDVTMPTTTRTLDASFLAFLYHTLPESHSTLRRGLSHEMRAAEKGIAKLVRERGAELRESDRLTAMGAALQAAGIKLSDLPLDAETDDKPLKEQTFNERSAIQRVTTLVLVAGRHGVPVPIDLALRILGREGSQSIRDALNSFDIIREIDDDNGEFFLSVRSHLEAELLAQQEISIDVEIEVITEAIRNVRVYEGYSGAADEVQFIVSLLERISPKTQAPEYRTYYGQISQALRSRREETGKPHPRLVLQESNLARDYVHWRQERGIDASADRIADLEHNRELLEDVLADSTLSAMMRLALTVELAATLGTTMYELSAEAEVGRAAGLAGRLDDILQAVLRAREIDPGNLYPVDVLAWSTRDAIKTGVLSPSERLDHLANAVATIDSIDRGPLSESQRAQLDRRGAELNKLLGDDDAFWANVRSLERNADPAATYFLAKFEAELGPQGEVDALKRLHAALPNTRNDWRCAQMLLELSWKNITGQRLLAGERVPIHLTLIDLQNLAQLVSELEDTELPDRYKLLFVKALVQFLSKDYDAARRTFRAVEQLTRQLSKRIYTIVLLADESGAPTIFTGRVQSAHDRAGEVWVNELGTKVAFEPRLFTASRQLGRHEQLPAFMIGFKLTRGPVAEPRNMYREPRPR